MKNAATTRATQWRADKIADGWKQKALLLPPQAVKDLAAAKARFALTDAEAVTLALKELRRGRN